MDYLDYFRQKRKPTSRLENVLLAYKLVKQYWREITKQHKSRMEEDYFSEFELKEWFSCLVDTPIIKLVDLYFRPELHGKENIPDESGALLTANHSGMGTDGVAIFYTIFKEKERVVSSFGDNLFKNSDFGKTFGVVAGNNRNPKKVLEEDRLALVCPGGSREVAKPFWKRYQVPKVGGFARGRYGYLLLSLETKKPIIPIGVVGAEETFFILGDAKPYIQKIVNLGYGLVPNKLKIKVADTFINALNKSNAFPLPLNFLPFPSKIDVWAGKPLEFYYDINRSEEHWIEEYQYLRKEKKHRPTKIYDSLEKKLSTMNDLVVSEIQGLIDEGRELLVLKNNRKIYK